MDSEHIHVDVQARLPGRRKRQGNRIQNPASPSLRISTENAYAPNGSITGLRVARTSNGVAMLSNAVSKNRRDCPVTPA